ncbi:MAG: DUF4332 domain-containing protein [Anaerolineales bacterium]|nr:MAG: DUF4332 domain-containing protein [Anaerolineales bacterium]
MVASYHIDASKYSLRKMKADLLNRDLIPSQIPLKEGLEEKFRNLDEAGLDTLQELILALKNKKKLKELALTTGIDENYLTLLRREANSYLPNPVSLEKFSGFLEGDVKQLAALGIKNSRQLFESIESDADLDSLARETDIRRDTLATLWGLSDLVRAYGVGPVFARILYDTGIQSIRIFRSSTPRQIIGLYQEKTNQKADFTISDLAFSLEIVKVLDIGVEK